MITRTRRKKGGTITVLIPAVQKGKIKIAGRGEKKGDVEYCAVGTCRGKADQFGRNKERVGVDRLFPTTSKKRGRGRGEEQFKKRKKYLTYILGAEKKRAAYQISSIPLREGGKKKRGTSKKLPPFMH